MLLDYHDGLSNQSGFDIVDILTNFIANACRGLGDVACVDPSLVFLGFNDVTNVYSIKSEPMSYLEVEQISDGYSLQDHDEDQTKRTKRFASRCCLNLKCLMSSKMCWLRTDWKSPHWSLWQCGLLPYSTSWGSDPILFELCQFVIVRILIRSSFQTRVPETEKEKPHLEILWPDRRSSSILQNLSSKIPRF